MRFVITLLIALASGFAQSPPPVVRGVTLNLTHGQILDNTTPQYDQVTAALGVTGTVTLPIGEPETDYTLRVNGYVTTLTADGAVPGRFLFGRQIPMGPNAPPGGWPTAFPYVNFYTDADRITKPVVAELIRNSNFVAVARTRVMLIDKRRDPSLNPSVGSNTLQKSLGVEITQAGLDALEPLHLATMPRPSLAAFNSTLTNNFRGFRASIPMTTNLNNASPGNPPPYTENTDRACVPVNSLPNAFIQTSNYAALVANALTNYAIYRAAVEARDNASIPASLISVIPGGAALGGVILSGYQWFINNQCVQDIPLPGDFELCANGLSGEARTLTVASLDRIELGLGAPMASPPQLTAQNFLGRLDGEIDAKLTGAVFFRYKGRPTSGCSVRPQVSINETAFTSNADLDLARTCRRLELDYPAPFTPGVIPYTIGTDAASTERNLLGAGVAPNPLFNLGGDRAKNENKDICDRTNFSPFANTLLNSFVDRERDALNRTWNANTPNTQQAQGLDLIFSRWETGIFGDIGLNDHILTQTYNSTNSLTQADRIAYLTNSKAERVASTTTVTGIQSDAAPFPCGTGAAPCANGRSFFGQRFDMSYTVTTGALNQVVRELSATPLIEYNYQPTYADLSIAPPAGVAATTAATLNAATLSAISPAFNSLGNQALSISVRTGGIRPFTYINPDPLPNPAPIPEGRRNLTYQLPQYIMELSSPDPGNPANPPVVWMRILLDFYDPQFDLSMGSQPILNRLTPAWSGLEYWTETVESTRFDSCTTLGFNPPQFITLPSGLVSEVRPECAAPVASRFTAALKTNIKNNLLYLLSRFPAPILFDAQGQVSNQSAPKFRGLDKYQQTQVITFYGELRP